MSGIDVLKYLWGLRHKINKKNHSILSFAVVGHCLKTLCGNDASEPVCLVDKKGAYKDIGIPAVSS